MSQPVDARSVAESSPPQPSRTEAVLPLVEERLEVSRQQQETGAVRVRIEVQETTETVPVELLSEQAGVRRVPVGREVPERQPPHQDGDEWVVPVYEEVPVVEMRLVLKEEIRLSRQAMRETREQQVRLRREVAVVERRQPDGSWQPEPESTAPGAGQETPPPGAA
ncbi:YsnF/AvaK domain-containing protein [Caldimonas tepidiphila]|uniref:YsnF/AvaK domain-containing protein n=1 Tax=Caldimonas tepidiphila TaxID=2315841 RepID=UPI000E5ACFC4|nr:YsnF/AvaK domain-containing protein [Caldimonas tepidiphila]